MEQFCRRFGKCCQFFLANLATLWKFRLVVRNDSNTLIYQLATSSSVIIKVAFEELNDEGSDTVFHA